MFNKLVGSLVVGIEHGLNAWLLAKMEKYCSTAAFETSLRAALAGCTSTSDTAPCGELWQLLASGLGIGDLTAGLNALFLSEFISGELLVYVNLPQPLTDDALSSMTPFQACFVRNMWYLLKDSEQNAEWASLIGDIKSYPYSTISKYESLMAKDSGRLAMIAAFLKFVPIYSIEGGWFVQGGGIWPQVYIDACVVYAALTIRGCQLPSETTPINGLAANGISPHPGCAFAWHVWNSGSFKTKVSAEQSKLVHEALTSQARCGNWLP